VGEELTLEAKDLTQRGITNLRQRKDNLKQTADNTLQEADMFVRTYFGPVVDRLTRPFFGLVPPFSVKISSPPSPSVVVVNQTMPFSQQDQPQGTGQQAQQQQSKQLSNEPTTTGMSSTSEKTEDKSRLSSSTSSQQQSSPWTGDLKSTGSQSSPWTGEQRSMESQQSMQQGGSAQNPSLQQRQPWDAHQQQQPWDINQQQQQPQIHSQLHPQPWNDPQRFAQQGPISDTTSRNMGVDVAAHGTSGGKQQKSQQQPQSMKKSQML
jgi:hypothetical protein